MKKSVIVFLSLFLFISAPFHANANIVTTTGKYLITAVKHVTGGAKVTATNSVTGAKHVATHGVSAPALGTAIGAGIVGSLITGGLGIAFQAITGLALDAVDWVMDKENNQIKWKEKGGSSASNASSPVFSDFHGVNYYTPNSFCNAAIGYYQSQGNFVGQTISSSASPGKWHCYGDGKEITWNFTQTNPDYDPSASPGGYQSLPLVDLAKKVIDLADAGNPAAQKTIEDYVTHLAKEGELDNDLDNSTDITKPEGTEPEPEPPIKCPPNTVNVEGVCIGKSDTDESLWCNSTDFSKKICDWIDWTQVKHDEPLPDAGKVDVIDKSKDLNIDKNRIDFSNQCPAPTPINTSVGGFPISTELNYQPLCDFFTMLNPFVIGMGGISSALIIAGGVRRG